MHYGINKSKGSVIDPLKILRHTMRTPHYSVVKLIFINMPSFDTLITPTCLHTTEHSMKCAATAL